MRALLAQDYPTFEVILLDDDSHDDTYALALGEGRGDTRLTVAHGAPLPPAWGGKNWACHQLAAMAQHDLLIFTDADVIWSEGALAAVVRSVHAYQADLLTVWPTQQTVTWIERLVVPLMAFSVFAYLPSWLVHRTPYPTAAAATGQCMAFRRAAYNAIGGHGAVRATVLEDVTLARRVKAAGLRLVMIEAAGLILCRMYLGWRQVFDGYTKNILAGHGRSIPLLIASTIFHLALFVLPLVWLVAGFFASVPFWPRWPLALLALGIGARALTAYCTRQRVGDALLMPLSVLLLSAIALRASWRQLRHGGQSWKGRHMPSPTHLA